MLVMKHYIPHNLNTVLIQHLNRDNDAFIYNVKSYNLLLFMFVM